MINSPTDIVFSLSSLVFCVEGRIATASSGGRVYSVRMLVAESSEEGGDFIRIAPFRTKFRSAERIFVRHADRRLVNRSQRMKPLFGAAARIVIGVLADIQRNFRTLDFDCFAFVRK